MPFRTLYPISRDNIEGIDPPWYKESIFVARLTSESHGLRINPTALVCAVIFGISDFVGIEWQEQWTLIASFAPMISKTSNLDI